MNPNLTFADIAVRLLLAGGAGLVIGINRGEHGRVAGMRTTLLVCLASAFSMILANYLLATNGKTSASFVVLDPMRLPLGVLSGMGFIGAGAILRKNGLVLGVTTAATLWYVTIMGMCFGAGCLTLGVTALVLGGTTLWGLSLIEPSLLRDVPGSLRIVSDLNGPSEEELREQIAKSGAQILSWGISFDRSTATRNFCCDVVLQKRRRGELSPSALLSKFLSDAQIVSVEWEPQGQTSDESTAGKAPEMVSHARLYDRDTPR